MSAPILVTGGTGALGRLVVARLRQAGRDVRVLSRGHRDAIEGVEAVTADLAADQGLRAALDGTEIVVHCAGGPKGDDVLARNLARAASAAGTKHLVNVSVVGADRIPVVGRVDHAMFGYFASKLAAEQVVSASGLPFTTLRATQFHNLVLTVVEQMARLPVIPVPAKFRFQPVDADDIAARLVELALGEPLGLAPELGGPRVYSTTELLRGYLSATARRRLVLPVVLPGRAARALRAGANLTPEHAMGRRTWESHLAEHLRQEGQPRPAA